MARKLANIKTPKRPLPKPPSPMPWFFVGASMFLAGVYAIFEGWAWMAWIIIGLAPFIVAILPMEINDFLRRKRICEHIRRDFILEHDSGYSDAANHDQFTAALHGTYAKQNHDRHSRGSEWASSAPDLRTSTGHTR